MTRLTVFLSLLIFPFVAQAQTQAPNTFQAGQPARAAEVNENFDTLESAIDDNTAASVANAAEISSNATAIAVNAANVSGNMTAIENNASAIASLASGSGIYLYSQGAPIGRFLSLWNFGNTDNFWAISDKGYVFMINPLSDEPEYLVGAKVAYSAADCTGDAYLILEDQDPASLFKWAAVVGHVVRLKEDPNWPTTIYYTQKGSGYVSITYQTSHNGGCQGFPGQTDFAIPLTVNDPAVTGVSNTRPSGPFTLGAP